MKIYGVATSRTRRALWTAEQAGADYEFVKIDFSKGDHISEWYLKVNPNCRVPALVDDDLTLFESAAICMYIARKYPESNLLPTTARGVALHEQWMFWITSEIEQALWSMGKHKFALPKPYRIPEMKKTALFEFERAAKVISKELGDRKFLVEDHLTVADLMLAHTLAWARGFGVPIGADNLESYLDEKLSLPSYEATKKHE